MKRLNDEEFIFSQPDMDCIYGIRIKNNEFRLLAYMENAERYRIKQSMDSDGDPLCADAFISIGEIISGENMPSCMYILYELDDNGNPVDDADKKFRNAHDCFLSLISPYTVNGVSDGDHDIFQLTADELSAISDALRDGDYVLVVTK